ncbi:hypothetical protein GCM10009868_22740 [Terrabacter aerolatus]|uniref:Uncharacterized protein n=1 Tax=Terrabacter aerolatus TaxID=422442 RepID=A0A512D1N9_9MICO|nr:hypothetical protein [Terrabacter aerolatus]GEO30376.1 hypothetical protein TAE01_21860 [Terrabacter aerolatus]
MTTSPPRTTALRRSRTSSGQVRGRVRARALAAAAMLVLMVGSVVLSAQSAAAATTPGRALWVWSWTDAGSVVQLAQNRGVSTLFVAVPVDLPTSADLPKVRDLVAQARAAGLRVDALGGDPGWVDNPTWAVDHWVRPTVAAGLFTGLHVDVEPWTTAAWTTRQSAMVSAYLTLLDRIVSASTGRSVEADIPFWFNQVKAGKRSTLDRETMRRVSAVTVMAYRNTAAGTDGTLALAAAELASAASLGKPVRLGQETTYLGPDPTEVKQTFFGQTLSRMNDQLAQVDAGASAYATYAGIAVHDATGYAAMAP